MTLVDRPTSGPSDRIDTGRHRLDVDDDPTVVDAHRPVSYGWHPRAALQVAVVIAAAALVVAVLDWAGVAVPGVIQIPAVLLGVFLLPGVPIVVALRIPGRALATALIVSASLSVNILATQMSMVLEQWHPKQTQTILLVVGLVATLAAFRTVPDRFRTGPLGLSRAHWTPGRLAMLAALAASLALFIVAAKGIDIMEAGPHGVVTVVGPWYFLGLLLLAATIVLTLRATHIDHIVMSAAAALAVVYNTMLVAVATGETSVPTAFVHRGFISVLAAMHRLPNLEDARYSWAGFFSLGTHVQETAGFADLTDVLFWAPVVFGPLLCFGLYAIASAIGGNARIAWMAVLLYQAFNWYQQDYFAPQAVAGLGYVAILGTLLWQLRRAPLPTAAGLDRILPGRVGAVLSLARRTPGRVPGFGPGRTLAIAATLLLIITANAVSHQMTPMLTVLALAAFAVTGTTRYRTMWLAAGLVFAAWFSYGATDFWMGHLNSLFNEVGQIGYSVNRGVGQRLNGDPTYKNMQYLRMAASGAFVIVAFVGWLTCRGRRVWLVSGLLCAAPFVLVALQSYGGEMIIRVFLLASPTLAPFVAIALVKVSRKLRRLPTMLVTVVAIILALGAGVLETTNRGLNAAFEASTPAEDALTQGLINKIPPNSSVMVFSHAPHSVGPRRTMDPNRPIVGYIDSFPCLDNLAQCTENRRPDYVLITHQGIEMMDLQLGKPAAEMEVDIGELLKLDDYELFVDTPSVRILHFVDAPAVDLSAELARSEGKDS
ncbi:MAG: hypothetical protein WAV90_05270 [Gordonia amarae]